MKRLLLLNIFLLIGIGLYAQTPDLNSYNQSRLQRQKTGMMVLGGWAVANIAGGLALRSGAEGSQKHFHTMNAAWNVVNLGIAGLGYFAAIKSDPASFDLYATIHEQHKLQKILLFNAGLDLGYMAGGLYLMERSKNATKNVEQMKGFGRSIILQGAFLFVFDVANHIWHASANPEIQQLLGAIQFSGDRVGLVLQF